MKTNDNIIKDPIDLRNHLSVSDYGKTFWSPVFGYLELVLIDWSTDLSNDKAVLFFDSVPNDCMYSFNKEGKYVIRDINYNDTECVVFPSKNNKDWKTYKNETKCDIQEIEIKNDNDNNHSYVDLRLPSGLLWATCNVGATKPEDYGDYFAWGETDTKDRYTRENSKTWNELAVDISDTNDDVARAWWGNGWCIPTESEWEELNNKCQWQWTNVNGIKGYKVTGPNGNSIFLPAAGYRDGSGLYFVGLSGGYWSSTPSEDDDNGAYSLSFYDKDQSVNWNARHYGQNIRPVKNGINKIVFAEKETIENKEKTMENMEKTSIKLWVARDKVGNIGVYRKKPNWRVANGCHIEDWHDGMFAMLLDPQEFPEVTFENSPKQVEVSICDNLNSKNHEKN